MAQPLGDSAFWILTVLAGERRHGYAIVREVEEASDGAMRLKATTLYSVLDRLAADGLVASDGDEVVEGRTRRYFRLTSTGASRLQQETELLDAKANAARTVLARLRPAAEGLA